MSPAGTKNRVTLGNLLTAVLVLFAAGTAWGISNSRSSENEDSVNQLKSDFRVLENTIEIRLAEIRDDTKQLNITIAEIANDVKWLKENQDN